MLLSKGHLTGKALDSNPKPRMCSLQFTTPEIRFHQVPVKCFPSASLCYSASVRKSVRKVGGVSRGQGWSVFAAL